MLGSIFGSCDLIKKESLLLNGDQYYLDEYVISDTKQNLSKSFGYIMQKNDTLYFSKKNYNECNEIWKLGVLNNKKQKTLTLNNKCGSTTIIHHMVSEIIDDAFISNDGKVYLFEINYGSNVSLDVKDSKYSVFYSKNEGIINILKRDEINMEIW